MLRLIGVLLLVAGIAGLAVGTFQYTQKKNVLDARPIQVERTDEETITVPPPATGAAADAESLRTETRRLRPDVVLAGLRLLLACPAGAPSKAAPGVAFRILASERDDARAHLLPLDISGWVSRSSTALDLREAVRAAAGTPGRDAAGQRTARWGHPAGQRGRAPARPGGKVALAYS